MAKSAKVENGTVVQVIMGELPGYEPCSDEVQIGWLHDGEAFITPPPEPEPGLPIDELWDALRAERDGLIAATDWLVQRHAEELALDIATTLTPEQHADLLTYRQALRDLPDNTTDPADPVWPVNPVG